MITLKRLQVHNFKGLRDVDLHFPDQGSLLIEGHNEAGKSTLFEAVYVALYGKPLVGEERQARLEEVIQHGQPKATVELTLTIGEQTLTVTRIFERNRAQYASLTIQHPGMQPETVNRSRTVNERLLKELGNLDGESLRNSCFVEQKELGRIEALDPTKREEAVHKLLGLERLTHMMDEFKWRSEQKTELAQAEQLLNLAQIQEQARTLAREETALAERFDAVKVAAYLQQLVSLARQKERQEQRLRELSERIQQAQERLVHCRALREQLTHCTHMTHTLADLAATRSDVKRLRQELEQLAAKEQVELPEARAALQQIEHVAEEVTLVTQMRMSLQEATARVQESQRLLKALQQAEADQEQKAADVVRIHTRSELHDGDAQKAQQRLEEKLQTLAAKQERLGQALDLVLQWETASQQVISIEQEIEAANNQQQEIQRLQAALTQQEQSVRDCTVMAEQAEQSRDQASEVVRRATASEELATWIRLKKVERALSGYAEHQRSLLTNQQLAETTLAEARTRARIPLVLSLVLTVAFVLTLLAGLFWLPAFVLCACCAGGAIASWIWLNRANQRVKQRISERNRYGTELQQLEMHRQAALQTGGDPAALLSHEQHIQQAGLDLPASLEAGQAVLDDLRQRVGSGNIAQARAAEQHARDEAVQAREQLKHAQESADERRQALNHAQAAGDPADQLRALASQLSEQKERVASTEQRAAQALQEDGSWPTRSQDVQAARAACQAEYNATVEAQQRQAEDTARLQAEDRADLEQAQLLLRQAQDAVRQQRSLNPAAQVERAQAVFQTAQAEANQQETLIQQLLAELHLETEASVETERGRAEARIQRLENDLATRPAREAEYLEQSTTLQQKVTATATSLATLYQTAQNLVEVALPAFATSTDRNDDTQPLETSWSSSLEQLEAALRHTLTALDETGTQVQRDTALNDQGGVEREIESLLEERQKNEQLIADQFTRRQLPAPSDFTLEAVEASWPLVAQVTPEEEKQVEQQLTEKRQRLYAARQQEQALAEACGQPATLFSIDECQHKVGELREDRDIRAQARKLLQEARDRIARHVLPITEHNMQPLLQQLTSGRYHDVRLTPEETDGQPGEMDYRIRVWDPAAGRFVAKNLFSGGTRDQCSLALRLAFALATLPQELGVAPGFIFLDEPLSAFDAQRAQALVELLTTGTIAQQFSQVVLISHYHAFDRQAFRYHVRMESGQIVESDLSSAETVEALLPAQLA